MRLSKDETSLLSSCTGKINEDYESILVKLKSHFAPLVDFDNKKSKKSNVTEYATKYGEFLLQLVTDTTGSIETCKHQDIPIECCQFGTYSILAFTHRSSSGSTGQDKIAVEV